MLSGKCLLGRLFSFVFPLVLACLFVLSVDLASCHAGGSGNADFNSDGDVDVSQIQIGPGGVENVGDGSVLLANAGNAGTLSQGDADGDGHITGIGDFRIFLRQVGSSNPPSDPSTPLPPLNVSAVPTATYNPNDGLVKILFDTASSDDLAALYAVNTAGGLITSPTITQPAQILLNTISPYTLPGFAAGSTSVDALSTSPIVGPGMFQFTVPTTTDETDLQLFYQRINDFKLPIVVTNTVTLETHSGVCACVVPEPSSLFLLLLAGVPLTLRRSPRNA